MTAEPAQLVVRVVGTGDPLARPLFEDLAKEYGTRYGGTPEQIQAELERYPAVEFQEPHGVLLLLLEGGCPRRAGRLAEVQQCSAGRDPSLVPERPTLDGQLVGPELRMGRHLVDLGLAAASLVVEDA